MEPTVKKFPKMPRAIEATDERNPTGSLSAFKNVQITDIFGNTRWRRISLGVAHCVTVETAKDMVKVARDADMTTNAKFTMYL